MTMKSLTHFSKHVLRKTRSLVFSITLSFPRHVECNVCGWQGRHFRSDRWHPNIICPRCGSQIRHRLLVAALSQMGSSLSYEHIVKNKRVLHFAPEQTIEDVFRKHTDRYVTADYYRQGCDLKLDISDMASVNSDEFDLLVACDVLEHVIDDIRAMSEIYRVLQVGGYAVLTVPQKDGLEKTSGDKSIIDPIDRERVFGQADHLRIYGNDFPKLLEMAGFKVTVINEKNFPDDLVKRHVLFPPILSKRPQATNYRKVFFARKTNQRIEQ